MGNINEFRRRQLASSIVGVAPTDSSGRKIGAGISTLGAALTERQTALDNAEVTKTYYEYAAAAALGSAELMQKYQSDPSLDPLTFDNAYQEQAGLLATKFKERMPDRILNKFDLLVAKGTANQSITNTRWAFAQQNKNLLEGFFELGASAAILAGEAMNADDYLNGRANYMEASQAFRGTMTPASMKRTMGSSLKQQAIMFWNNSVDYRNGGDPVKFSTDLKESKELRETMRKDIGEREFKSLEKGLGALIKQMGVDQGFQKVVSNNEQLNEKVNKLYDPNNNYGLKQISSEVEAEINKRNYMVSTNTDGQNTAAITHTEENIQNLQKLKRIAAFVNDSSYTSDPEIMTELQAEIRVGMSPYRGGKFEKKLARVKKNIAKQTSKQDLKFAWYEYLNPFAGASLPFRRVQELITGVPKEVRVEAKEDVVANPIISEYMESAQTLNGRILAAVDAKKLTYRDGMKLINQVGMLSDVKKYDSLTTKGNNWYAQGYDSFNDYVRALDLNTGTVEVNRRLRDDIKSQMLDSLSKRIASFGDVPLSPEKITEIIGQIKFEKSKQIHPEIMGAKVGDYVGIGGRQYKFLGFAANTGRPIFDTKELKKAIGNQ